ncbi:MAG: hypothetical protein WAO08_06275 [Hyphomicrobiaceae bacterium]
MTEQHQPAATAKLRTDLLLGGFRSIDVASCMAAPVAAMRLGGHGENVVEVEPVVDGDPNWLMAVHSPANAKCPVNDLWHPGARWPSARWRLIRTRLRAAFGADAAEVLGQAGIGAGEIAALTAAGAWR